MYVYSLFLKVNKLHSCGNAIICFLLNTKKKKKILIVCLLWPTHICLCARQMVADIKRTRKKENLQISRKAAGTDRQRGRQTVRQTDTCWTQRA